MARKKEPQLGLVNRERIARIASELFAKKGVENTTMNDIAKVAIMSKSTLYVYFKNKEEVKNYLSLEAMNYLYTQMEKATLPRTKDVRDCFMSICQVLVEFKKKYPLNFELVIDEICVEDDVLQKDIILASIYRTGEKINQLIFSCFSDELSYSNKNELFVTIFSLWGSIYGIISLADNKEQYLKKITGISKDDFMRSSFESLFLSLSWKEKN